MSDYTWPGFPVTRFSLRIEPLTKSFASPYSNQMQTVDLMAECWKVQMDMTQGTVLATGLAIEAFFDRLKGAANRCILWNLKLSLPQGTMRGTPTLNAAAAQLANTVSIGTTAGATVLAGDMLGIGGQLCRVMANATADGSGNLSVEIAPRLRVAMGSGTSVVWNAPTAPFLLASANPAVDWRPGLYIPPAVEWRESF